MATYLVRDIAQRKESLEKIAREAVLVEEVGGRGGLQQGPGRERSSAGLLWGGSQVASRGHLEPPDYPTFTVVLLFSLL